MGRSQSQLVIILLIFFGGIAIPHHVFSEMRKAQTEILTLGEVVVRGKREGVESIGTVREIKAQEIRNKGARTLAEAIELLPGLDVRTGADGVPRVNLRGFRSRHTVLLLNGIPINSTFDGQFDPSIIPVENIAKIKVSYGNHSVLYGEGGLGGVVNIVTKKGEKGVHGTALGEVSERDGYLGQFSLSGARENVDYFLSASSFRRDAFRLSDDFEPTTEEDGGLRENSDKKRRNLFANTGFSPNENWRIGIFLNYLKGEFGKPPSALTTSIDPLFANNPKFERIEDFEGFSGQLSTSYDLPGPLGIRAWVFLNRLDEEENRYDDSSFNTMDDPSVKTFHQDSETAIKGGTLQTACDLKSAGLLTLGLSAEKREFESTGRIRDVQIKKKTFAFRDFDTDRDVKIYSAALEYEFSPFRNLGLVLGYSHHWFKKQDAGDGDRGSFLTGAHYDITKNTRIRGSVAKKIRFPSIRQLYEGESGNPNLTTEKSYNYELGIEQKLPWATSLILTAFYIDVEDYIEKIPPDDTFRNNDEYRFKGFELTAENHFVKNLLLRIGYSYMKTKDRSPATERKELQLRPMHKVTFEGKYSFGFGLSTYLNVMHVADQYFYSRQTPLIKRELNDYTLVNIKLDKVLISDRFQAYLGADNLLDKDYEESFGFPQAGRTIYGGAEIRF